MLPDFARLSICAFSNHNYYEQQRQVSLFVSKCEGRLHFITIEKHDNGTCPPDPLPREERSPPLERELRDVLGLADDGHGVDGEVELVRRQAAPPARPVLPPQPRQVARPEVADAAQHLWW